MVDPSRWMLRWGREQNHEGTGEATTELTDDPDKSNPIPSTTSGEGFIFIIINLMDQGFRKEKTRLIIKLDCSRSRPKHHNAAPLASGNLREPAFLLLTAEAGHHCML